MAAILVKVTGLGQADDLLLGAFADNILAAFPADTGRPDNTTNILGFGDAENISFNRNSRFFVAYGRKTPVFSMGLVKSSEGIQTIQFVVRQVKIFKFKDDGPVLPDQPILGPDDLGRCS